MRLPRDSTCILETEPGKFDIKRPEPGIQFISLQVGSLSAGHCVIPCAFFGKVSNIHFLVEKCIPFKKKGVYNFSLAF